MNKTINNKEFLVKLLPAILFIIAMGIATIKLAPYIKSTVADFSAFRELIRSYGGIGAFVLIGFQFIQILIPVLPGEFVQLAGGYVYGTLLGTAYLLLGTILGSIAAFFLAKLIGFPLVSMLVGEEKLEKFKKTLENGKTEITLFLLFLIPGIPKDVLVYVAGLLPIKPWRFIFVSMVGRFPALLGSAYIGSHLQSKNYLPVIIVSVIAIILFVFGVRFKDKIIDTLSNAKK